MRSQSVQVDYVGCNNLMVQLWIESSKSKGQGPVKGVGCVGLSLVRIMRLKFFLVLFFEFFAKCFVM